MSGHSLLSGFHRGMFNPGGVITVHETHLFLFSTLIMMVVVIPVYIMTFWFARRFRQSNKQAPYSPDFNDSLTLEIIWWSIPCVIIIILGVATWITSHTLSPYRAIKSDKTPLQVEVVALNWKWLFIYPKQHIATVNYVELPVNRPVNFLITADAPMNSFMIPRLAGQIYAMTGMQTQLHVLATKTGQYFGMSANYSGTGFAGMHFTAHVVNAEQFEKWVNTVKSTTKTLSLKDYAALAKPSKRHPVTLYSNVTPKLFQTIIAKYTTPKTHETFKRLI